MGTPLRWYSVRVRSAAHRDEVIAALFDAGSQGVHEDGDSVVTHFPPAADIEQVRHLVRAADPAAEVTVGTVDATDWSEAWKHGIGAHALGSLTIAPPWLAEGHDPARTIVIDPGMAFGTGEHATTRGVVRLLQGVIRPGARVADLGAGSAVLAIAAAKLGAASVAAIEIDPDAISNAEENVVRNGVADTVRVIEGDAALLLPLVAPLDLILANIVSLVLTDLLPAIGDALAPGGRAILSGILQAEREQMLEVLARMGWVVEAEDHEDIWWSVLTSRR